MVNLPHSNTGEAFELVRLPGVAGGMFVTVSGTIRQDIATQAICLGLQ